MQDEAPSAFHCSFENCAFHQKKGFKRQVLLDQHILNCHTEKRHKCLNCGKQYAIAWQLKYHLKTCGSVWTCSTCHKVYKERLSLITHCNRNDHTLPEDAKQKNLISNKESQQRKLSNGFAISKYRPILPKNELSSNECNNSPLSLMVASVGANLLPLANHPNVRANVHPDVHMNLHSNTPTVRLVNGHDQFGFTPVESLNGTEPESARMAVISAGSNLRNLNLQSDYLVDNSCQTELLCQCPAQNVQSNKRDKSTNTPVVPPRAYLATSLKRKTRPSTVARQENHTQTYDSYFVERPVLKHQSTSTEINSDNFLSPKRRSVSSETTINNLSKNFCFLDGQTDHSDHPGNAHQLNAQMNTQINTQLNTQSNSQLNLSYQNIISVSNMPLGDQSASHPNGIGEDGNNQHLSLVPYEESNQQDPLLSTICVQTDLDYLDELGENLNSADQHLKGDHLNELLEFSDIQTQTYWNANDNFTQTDFSLFDMENLF